MSNVEADQRLMDLLKEQKKTNALLKKQNKFKHFMTTAGLIGNHYRYGCSCGKIFMNNHVLIKHIEEENK